MAELPVKAIPQDHPHRREFAKWEREFGETMTQALDKWRLVLFRDISEDNVMEIMNRLENADLQNILRDALTAELQKIALEGADRGRRQVEQEVFGVS